MVTQCLRPLAAPNSRPPKLPSRNRTKYDYDQLNRQERATDALGGVTYFVFDAAGNVLDTYVKLDATTWARRQAGYDDLGRQQSVTDPEGNHTMYVFDAVGNVTALVDPLLDASYFTYDCMRRPLTATNPLDETASLTYDASGNRASTKALGGEVTYLAYDALERFASFRADALGVDATTSYTYDAVGNRTKITDAMSHDTTFAYDCLDRLIREQDALGRTEYYGYDAVGNLAEVVDWDDNTTSYSYDELDRQTQIDFPEGYSAYFAYDAVGNVTGAWDDVETDAFVCDDLDRVIERTITGVGTLYYAYDLAGRRTMVQDWTGAATYYTYDRRSVIETVHSDAGWTYYTYDARGAVLTRHLPNDTWTYYAYDDAGRLDELANRKSDGTAISTFAFTRDANGNITESLREDASCWYYDYDGLQRLTKAEWKDSGGSLLYGYQYNYDKVGNRRSLLINGETACCYSYNAANELVSETNGSEEIEYEYDGRGNQIRRTVAEGTTHYFEYNSRNLITAITSDDPSFTPNYFEYNALSQRVTKTDSTGTTHYVWDGLNISHEHDGDGAVTRRYTHGHTAIDGLLSLIDVEDVSAGDHYFYHLDQVGGVQSLTAGDETVDRAYEFSPFGRILAETAGSAPSDFTFPATYVKLPDAAELRLSPTRLYDSRIGRMVQRDVVPSVRRDPVAAARWIKAAHPRRGRFAVQKARVIRTLKLYDLGEGRPTALVDPSGRDLWDVAGGVLSAPGNIVEAAGGLVEGAGGLAGYVPGVGGVVGPALTGAGQLTSAVGAAASGDLSGAQQNLQDAGQSGVAALAEPLRIVDPRNWQYALGGQLETDAGNILRWLRSEGIHSQINDNKVQHCIAMCLAQDRLGPLGAPLVTAYGPAYEAYHFFAPGHVPGMTPAGPPPSRWTPPFFGFFDGQHPVNWLYDTPGDMLANLWGQTMGTMTGGVGDCIRRCLCTLTIPGPNYEFGTAWTDLAYPGVTYQAMPPLPGPVAP